MEIKVDLSDEYHVQFYQDDDGNVVISGSVNCDCYDEEVVQVILSPAAVVELLGENWLKELLTIYIEKELQLHAANRERSWSKRAWVGMDKMLANVMEEHIKQPTLLERLRRGDKMNIPKKEITEDE